MRRYVSLSIDLRCLKYLRVNDVHLRNFRETSACKCLKKAKERRGMTIQEAASGSWLWSSSCFSCSNAVHRTSIPGMGKKSPGTSSTARRRIVFKRLLELLEGVELHEDEYSFLMAIFSTGCLAVGWYLAQWLSG